MKYYTKLEAINKRAAAFSHLGAIAGWDQAVNMPDGGSQARAEALSELYVYLTELRQTPEYKELIEKSETEVSQLSDWQLANLREIKRSWALANAVSTDLIEAKTKAGAKCEMAWRQYRKENNWRDFEPLLDEVLKLTREEAKQRANFTGLDPYDALLDLYEPGLKQKDLEILFGDLKKFLVPFIPKVLERQNSLNVIPATGPYSVEQQKRLGIELMKRVGFNFSHGRLDVSHHPFCGGVPQDVRITTRYHEGDFTQSLMGVLHETGHARYEQGLPNEWVSQPVGSARSMGIHESQSLLFEMQLSRSAEFLKFAAPLMKESLNRPGHNEDFWHHENLYKLFTKVKPDYIRVDADEATYPLHVILRFELEKEIVKGNLPTKDIPDMWNEKMKQYLNLSTEGNYKNGCMQDIHWTDGALGYFPTYTLGAMNAAQIFASAKRELPQLELQITRGEFQPLNEWLQKKVWSQASRWSTQDLMTQISGEPLNAKYFTKHLETRYLT